MFNELAAPPAEERLGGRTLHLVAGKGYAGRRDRPWTDTVQCAWNEPTEVAEAVISGC
ncbi:unnamed protein product, partial [Effrenium voratum]